MEAAAWKKLFESIRPEDQECLVVSVFGGLEVAVQSVAKVEDDVVLLRGRISGQADVGRVFVVPYDRLNSMYVNRYVQAEEVELFSPSVSLQRKEQIAKMIQAMKEKAREEAQAAELNRGNGTVSTDVRKQLEELREKKASLEAGGAAQPPAPLSKPPLPPSTTSRPNIPGRFTLPKRPGEDK